MKTHIYETALAAVAEALLEVESQELRQNLSGVILYLAETESRLKDLEELRERLSSDHWDMKCELSVSKATLQNNDRTWRNQLSRLEAAAENWQASFADDPASSAFVVTTLLSNLLRTIRSDMGDEVEN